MSQTMATKGINLGDFVWAKLRGYVPWPALVVEPNLDVPDKPKKEGDMDFYWVYFFGSHNYSWIEESSIKPYEEFREKFVSLQKTSSFKEAILEIDRHVEQKKADPTYEVVLLEKYRGKPVKRKRSPSKNIHMSRKRNATATSFSLSELYSSITPPLTSTESDEGEISTEHIKKQYGWCEMLETKNITASTKTFGVLGLGVIGQHIVRNLIKSGHKVNMWNRTLRKCNDLENELKNQAGDNIKSFLTSKSLIKKSDIVFLCISDHNACKSFVQSNCGINDPTDNVMKGKGLLMMTGIDPGTSKNVSDMLEKKGGKYLETQIQWGNQGPTLEDTLILLSAGDRSLFDSCQSCFKAIANSAIFLGDVGYATKLHLILQLIRSVCLAGVVEGLCLAERFGIDECHFHYIFSKCQLNSDFLKIKMKKILNKNFTTVEQQSVQNLQKDMKLGLDLSHKVGQPMNVSSVTNEIFKHCRRLEYGNHDSSVIYMRNRH